MMDLSPRGSALPPLTLPSLAPLYQLTGAGSSDHFVFSSSGAEAINAVFMGSFLEETRKTGKHHFLAAATEGMATLLSMKRLEEMGCHCERVFPVTAESFAEMMTPRTAMISLSVADGLTGIKHPIEEIAELCRERGVLLHLEATSILGRGHFSFAESKADFLSFKGEEGGGIYIRDGRELPPLIVGEENIDVKRLEGLCKAAQIAFDGADAFCLEKSTLQQRFEKGLAEIPGAHILFRDQPRLVSTTVVAFEGVHFEALAYLLAKQQIFPSGGGGEYQKLSTLLKICKIPAPLCYSALSFTLAKIDVKQLDFLLQSLKTAVLQLQRYVQGMSHEISFSV